VTVHRFDIASLSPAPWKNGGGVTREIVCSPPGAGMDGFDWRVSIATIDKPGPFSAFAGVDRAIMLMDGAGVRLRSADGRIDHRLDALHEPFAFSGDVALACELLGGTSMDFNVMSRRGRMRADVRVLRQSGAIAAVDRGLVLSLRGKWQLNDLVCEQGAGLWWDGEPWACNATSVEADSAIVTVRLESATSSSDEKP
jgi:environmental stress-induced protein Ves